MKTFQSSMLAELESDNPGQEQVMEWLESTGSVAYARGRARQCAQSALDFAAELPAGVGADSLKLMAQFVLERTF